MVTTTQGTLTMVNLHTSTAGIYWNGIEVPNITEVRADWENDDQRIKIEVTEINADLKSALESAGIIIKIK